MKKQKGQKNSRKKFEKQNFSAKSRKGGNPENKSLSANLDKNVFFY